MKNGGKNKSIAFIILFSVVISIPEMFNVLDLLDVHMGVLGRSKE